MDITTVAQTARLDDDFPGMSRALRHGSADTAKPPFFRTETPNLWATYLSSFPLETRQTYNCHCCRRFIEAYGTLVTVDEDGVQHSVFWGEVTGNSAPQAYRAAVANMRNIVERSRIEGLHLDDAEVWGVAETPDKKRGWTWTHFSIGALHRHRHPILTPSQREAEVREDRIMLVRAIGEFSREIVAQARQILQGEQLYRGEKVLGVAEWLLKLYDALGRERHGLRRDALLWRATATAPAGFCHVRSSMIGTLLEDLTSGMSFEDVKRRFADKMHPLQYQRPVAPPSVATIEQAEAAVAALGIGPALKRRFARIEDVQVRLWEPPAAAATPPPGGVFDHLRPGARGGEPRDIGGAAAMTFDKFARTLLPTAELVEYLVPSMVSLVALVTAEDPTAPPILQWDREDHRNPVSWYVYQGGRPAHQWNLQAGSWAKVRAVTTLPPAWTPGFHDGSGQGAILILEGCRDTGHERSGGFFVEQLRSELHGVRRVLEAYQMSAPVSGKETASACGVDLRRGQRWNVTVRVTTAGLRSTYVLDRWD